MLVFFVRSLIFCVMLILQLFGFCFPLHFTYPDDLHSWFILSIVRSYLCVFKSVISLQREVVKLVTYRNFLVLVYTKDLCVMDSLIVYMGQTKERVVSRRHSKFYQLFQHIAEFCNKTGYCDYFQYHKYH